MRKGVQYIIVLMAILFFAGPTSSKQKTRFQGLNFSYLKLEIATTKEEFVQVEPIPIILSLRNETKMPINGHTALEFRHGLIELFTIHNDSGRQKIQDLSPVSFTAVDSERIAPGEQHQTTQLLIIKLDKIFPEPGTYEIQAVLNDITSDKAIESNPVTVQIIEPAGIDSSALEYMETEGDPSYFLSGMALYDSDDAQNALEEFVQYFGDSSYGDYATYLLGRMYLFEAQYEEATEQISQVATKEDFVLADQALHYLVQANTKLGNMEEAEYYLEMLELRYPDSDYVE
jgi:TolA-binding protein